MNITDIFIMIISRQEINHLNLDGKVVGLTSGCFDLLHFYHLNYLERCKAQCDFLIVGVDSDELVYNNKKKTPMIPQHHRMEMVNALKCVDAVFCMTSNKDITTFYDVADKLFKNGNCIYGQPVFEGDIELVIVPDIEETTSTTELIEKIKKTAINDFLKDSGGLLDNSKLNEVPTQPRRTIEDLNSGITYDVQYNTETY